MPAYRVLSTARSTIIVYPLVFLILPRMCRFAHKHNVHHAGDFVEGQMRKTMARCRGDYWNRSATMPYIALQLVSLQVVIGAMGVGTVGFYGDLPVLLSLSSFLQRSLTLAGCAHRR